MKFVLPPSSNSNYISNAQWLENGANLQLLDRYKSLTLPILQSTIQSDELRHKMRERHQPNYTITDQSFMDDLINDARITIKPADKNLGLVLVDTEWYNREILRMLSDTTTYIRFNNKVNIDDKQHDCTPLTLSTLLYDQLQRIMKSHNSALLNWNRDAYAQIQKFIKGRVNRTTAIIPSIYLLIKVHKPKGLCGRPIVPCTNWVTAPASILVDYLLQEIVRKANITHIVKDTKSLVNELERTRVLCQDGIFVTADIASLYTNIDTDMGLKLVKEFLQEQNVSLTHQQLIMDLLSFVMRHSYLTFEDQIYHQVDGTAMGTQTAPIYANIIVYALERSVIAEFGENLYLYRRFLDDVFAYINPDDADRFMIRINQLHPKLKFEFSTHPTEAIFLDLNIHKGDRFNKKGEHNNELGNMFDLKVHQKPMNLYLYIPFNSYHTAASKRSFIQTELMRYIRNSSSRQYYIDLRNTFYSRLRDRGYPTHFLDPIFQSIFYADRKYFLYPSEELLSHPDILYDPPISQCLIRRIERSREVNNGVNPPVFIIPYTPMSHILPTRSILIRYWDIIEAAIGLPKPIIAYQTYPALVVRLVHQKAKRMKEKRLKELTC